jgi:hypothetical protein
MYCLKLQKNEKPLGLVQPYEDQIFLSVQDNKLRHYFYYGDILQA